MNEEMKILGEWDEGGLCPWQAYLPVEYYGIKYTIYVRERHDWYSCNIEYGIHDSSYGPNAKIRHLFGKEEEVPIKFFGTANLFDLFRSDDLKGGDYDPLEMDILEIAVERAREFFETARYLPGRVK